MDKNFKILQDFDLNRNDILNVENIVGPKNYTGLSKDLNIFTEDLSTNTGNINIHTGECTESITDNGSIIISSGNSDNNTGLIIDPKNLEIKTRISNIGDNLEKQTNVYISSDKNIGGNIEINSYEQNIFSNYVKVSNFAQYVPYQISAGEELPEDLFIVDENDKTKFVKCPKGSIAKENTDYYKEYTDGISDYIQYELLDTSESNDVKVIDRLKVYPKELIIGQKENSKTNQTNVQIYGGSDGNEERLEITSDNGGKIKTKSLEVSSDFKFNNEFTIYWDKDKNSLVFAKASN